MRATHGIEGAVLDEPFDRALLNGVAAGTDALTEGRESMRNELGAERRLEDELIEDPVMDEQIFRFLAAFTQIEEENLRERLIKITEWIVTPPRRGAHHREQLGQALTMRRTMR